MKRQGETCPECGKTDCLPIIWGCKPSDEGAKLIERGEAVLGGCDFFGATYCGTVMNRECQACGHQWHVRESA